MICDQCDAPFGPALPSAYCSDCMDSQVAAAVEAEREACARLAECSVELLPDYFSVERLLAGAIAAAIRARGKPKTEAPLCTCGRPRHTHACLGTFRPPAQAGASPTVDKDLLLEVAWGIIANASEGDWTKEHPDWQKAARRWADDYHRPFGTPPPAEHVHQWHNDGVDVCCPSCGEIWTQKTEGPKP